MKKMIAAFTLSLLAGCGAGNQESTTKEVSAPGFSTAKVLECAELAHAGAAHYRAEVLQDFHDFGSTYSVNVYDTLSSGSVPMAMLTHCSGTVAGNNLACDDANDPLRRPGFAQTFAINSAALPVASYEAITDSGLPAQIDFSCKTVGAR